MSDGTRPMTGSERRAYDGKVKRLRQADRAHGGHSAADFIDKEHAQFVAGGGGCLLVVIAAVGSLLGIVAAVRELLPL